MFYRYDPANSGTISAENFLKTLGITMQENGENGRLSPIAEGMLELYLSMDNLWWLID